MKTLCPGADPADLFDQIASFPALLAASARAARGKRNRRDAAAFLQGQERHLLALTDALRAGQWLPGSYRTVTLHEPKRRFISVAPFADRVVHQSVAAVVQPILERSYITDTYASMAGRGQHACVRRFEQFRDHHAWVLRLDMYRYFPSLDHAIVKADLRRHLRCACTLALLDTIIDGSNPQEPVERYFPGDDLFTPGNRRRGLPLGNLTSQVLGNLYLAGFDHWCKEVLRVKGYVRYLDDVAIFGDDPEALLALRHQLQGYLDGRRLLLHPRKTMLQPCAGTIHFLGYELLPGGRRRLPQANVSRAAARLAACRAGFADGSVKEDEVRQRLGGWVAHARQADTFRLRAQWFASGWFDPAGEPPRPRTSTGRQAG